MLTSSKTVEVLYDKQHGAWLVNIGIKYDSQCINMSLADVNAPENMFNRYYCIKTFCKILRKVEFLLYNNDAQKHEFTSS